MAFQWTIEIKRLLGRTPPVTFDPNPLPTPVVDGVKQSVLPGDEIIWSNNDPASPHWPGLKNSDGTISQTFFMPNQIAPRSTSDTYRPKQAGTLPYVCSLPGHENETGTIVVSAS